jgi:ABC-type transporter Mla maintaining outer membrane lipid asymmetry ATPase subunit MlaF
MLITSHHTQSTLRVADHLVLLQDGAAISGATRELLRDDPRVAEFFAEAPLRETAKGAP